MDDTFTESWIFWKISERESSFIGITTEKHVFGNSQQIVTASSNTKLTKLDTHWNTHTVQKMKFSITDFFSKCDQIRSLLRIWSHLLKKSWRENFIFCAVLVILSFVGFLKMRITFRRKLIKFVYFVWCVELFWNDGWISNPIASC